MRFKEQIREWMAFGLYAVLNITVTVFHEPWFDEAESWLIARDAPYYDILFIRPHYEGHPPLWHLILSIPAKLGIPFEPSIKAIQFFFAIVMVCMIIFHSPFPRHIRLFVPFTFFFFYQYGVIARPYAMFCVAMFLVAMFWKERDEKPWRVTASLMWLCLCSAYGIILAGGMTAVWLFESIINEKNWMIQNRRRLIAWGTLLVLAIILTVLIIPRADTHAMIYKSLSRRHGFWWSLLFMLVVVPSETVITSCADYACVFVQKTDPFTLAATAVGSLVIWAFLVCVARSRKKIALLFVPYMLLSIVAALSYFNVHHFGMVLAFLIGVLWICFCEKPVSSLRVGEMIRNMFPDAPASTVKLLSAGTVVFTVILLVLNVLWSAVSFSYDIKYNYGFGRDLAAFIRENNLDGYRWFGSWEITRDEDDSDRVLLEDSSAVNNVTVPVNPYFSQNLIYNAPDGVSYVTHKVSSLEQTAKDISRWASESEPDFILASVIDFPVIEEELGLNSNYVQLTISQSRRIWKADPFPNYPVYVFARRDICESLGLGRFGNSRSKLGYP